MEPSPPPAPVSPITKPIHEIADSIRKILEANDIKPGSKKARTVECSFLQGLMVGNEAYAKNQYIVITLMSGRSLLDKCQPQKQCQPQS